MLVGLNYRLFVSVNVASSRGRVLYNIWCLTFEELELCRMIYWRLHGRTIFYVYVSEDDGIRLVNGFVRATDDLARACLATSERNVMAARLVICT